MNRKGISIALALALAAIALPRLAAAGKVTYITTDHRFDFVRLKEVKEKEAERLAMTHPQQVDVQGLRSALTAVNLARSYIIKKEVDTQRVFNDGAVDYLSVGLSRAFAQAQPNQIVEFSYLQKEPIFILRNDRINMGKAWISADGLHLRFDKLYAKVLGDTDARGHEAEAVSRAVGLRVRLDASPGQQMSIDNQDEVILDLHHNFAEDLQKKAKEPEPILKTIAGEEAVPAPEPTPAKAEGKKAGKKSAKAEAQAEASAAPEAAAPAPSSSEQRLRALDQMRKDGLITKKEYEQKKKEILQGL